MSYASKTKPRQQLLVTGAYHHEKSLFALLMRNSSI